MRTGPDPVLQAQVRRSFGRNFRFWAALASDAVITVTLSDRAGTVLGVLRRPTFPAGVCRYCGCSHFDPCFLEFDTCAWADRSQRVCTNPDCLQRHRVEARRRKAARA